MCPWWCVRSTWNTYIPSFAAWLIFCSFFSFEQCEWNNIRPIIRCSCGLVPLISMKLNNRERKKSHFLIHSFGNEDEWMSWVRTESNYWMKNFILLLSLPLNILAFSNRYTSYVIKPSNSRDTHDLIGSFYRDNARRREEKKAKTNEISNNCCAARHCRHKNQLIYSFRKTYNNNNNNKTRGEENFPNRRSRRHWFAGYSSIVSLNSPTNFRVLVDFLRLTWSLLNWGDSQYQDRSKKEKKRRWAAFIKKSIRKCETLRYHSSLWISHSLCKIVLSNK